LKVVIFFRLVLQRLEATEFANQWSWWTQTCWFW